MKRNSHFFANGHDTASQQPFVLSHSPAHNRNSRSHSRIEIFRKQLEIEKQVNQTKRWQQREKNGRKSSNRKWGGDLIRLNEFYLCVLLRKNRLNGNLSWVKEKFMTILRSRQLTAIPCLPLVSRWISNFSASNFFYIHKNKKPQFKRILIHSAINRETRSEKSSRDDHFWLRRRFWDSRDNLSGTN